MPMLARLRDFLDSNHIRYTVRTHNPAFTAAEVAAAQHVPGRDLAKVVMVKAGDRFVMTVLPATERLDVHKLPLRGGHLASEHEFQSLFPSCEPGAMPPFGNLFDLPVFVDAHLAEEDEIVFQAGSHSETVRMRYQDFERLVHPTVDDYALTHEDV